MKNTHQCPKCGSCGIIRINGNVGPYGTGNNVMLGATIFSGIKVNRYVCCHCGFTEEWIDPQDLPKVKNSSKAIPL